MPALLESSLVRTEEAALLLHVAAQTLCVWRLKGCGPKFIKMGRAVRYRREDLEEFIARGERQNTGDAG